MPYAASAATPGSAGALRGMRIGVTGISTRDEKRDAHLKSPEGAKQAARIIDQVLDTLMHKHPRDIPRRATGD